MRNLTKKELRQEIFKTNGELKKSYLRAIEQINSTKIYPNSWMNNGRNLISFKSQAINIINLLGYKYNISNDAPRGGVEGEYIKISTVCLGKIKSLA